MFKESATELIIILILKLLGLNTLIQKLFRFTEAFLDYAQRKINLLLVDDQRRSESQHIAHSNLE